jgi:diguanylate cyclase (GGDEF)-like protein
VIHARTLRRLPPRSEPRLLSSFLAVTAIGLLLAGVGILVVVERALAGQAERQAIDRARVTATVLDRQLRVTDLAAPISRARHDELTRLLAPAWLGRGSLGATLISRQRIVVSTAPARLPTANAREIRRALIGSTISVVEPTPSGRVLRTFLPIRVGGGEGVLELDQDYAAIVAPAGRTAWWAAGILEGLLIALCALLSPMLARAARRLRDQVQLLDTMASHDELTGLLNRAGFRRQVGEVLTTGEGGALLLVDIDGFHEINETIGTENGDALLVLAADRLTRVPAGRSLARLGADEFAMLLPDVGEEELAEVVRTLSELFTEAFQIDRIRLALEASFGAAFYPTHGADSEMILRHASTALSHAKEHHLPSSIYASDQERHDLARLSFVAELRDALDDQQLVVHYQPQLDLTTSRLSSVEALIRWQHPTRGLLDAGKFIDAAERSGLIGELGRHVLGAATEQWREWKDQGISLDVAVNLSTIDLLDLTLPGTITALLVEHEMPAERLVLEITERTLLPGDQRTNKVLRQLERLGVRLSIDDYGTGWSSLASLRQLPIQQVKIDKTFIHGLPQDIANDQIVRSTIELAHTLGLYVVAEGVESIDELDHLTTLGCDAVQGYLISRPHDAEQLTPHLPQTEPVSDSVHQPDELAPLAKA